MGLSVVYGETLVGLVVLSFEITGDLSACREGAVWATHAYTGGKVTTYVSLRLRKYVPRDWTDQSSLASHSGLSLILDYPVSPGVSPYAHPWIYGRGTKGSFTTL